MRLYRVYDYGRHLGDFTAKEIALGIDSRALGSRSSVVVGGRQLRPLEVAPVLSALLLLQRRRNGAWMALVFVLFVLFCYVTGFRQ